MTDSKRKKASGSEPADAEDHGQDQVQETMDEEQDKGYRGVKVDPTPNENYSVEGVTKGLPTPETDPALDARARSRQRDIAEGTAPKERDR